MAESGFNSSFKDGSLHITDYGNRDANIRYSRDMDIRTGDLTNRHLVDQGNKPRDILNLPNCNVLNDDMYQH